MADMDEPIKGYLALDTEGSGLFNYKLPADAEGQPRMASLAMIFLTPELEVEKEYHQFVRPEGWTMGSEASRITGLTDEYLNEHGVPVVEALNEYGSAIDNGYVFCAHNSSHDAKQLRAELRRAGMNDKFEETPTICTMRSMTDICKIPPKGNRGGYKWPALSEALLFIHADQLGDHSALNDARGVAELLRYLKKIDRLPDPRVNYAKNRPIPE